MSEPTWGKRKAQRMDCPSGAVCYVRRPGPEISLKGGRLAHIFLPKVGGSFDETAFSELSDDEAAKVYMFAREMVLGAVVTPELSSQEDGDKLTPEDLPPQDFWHVFTWAMRGGRDLPVELKEGETTVESVENFPIEQTAVNDAGSDSEQVQQEPV